MPAYYRYTSSTYDTHTGDRPCIFGSCTGWSYCGPVVRTHCASESAATCTAVLINTANCCCSCCAPTALVQGFARQPECVYRTPIPGKLLSLSAAHSGINRHHIPVRQLIARGRHYGFPYCLRIYHRTCYFTLKVTRACGASMAPELSRMK